MSLDPEVRSYLEERKLSQSFLARMDACPHSAYLYAKTRAIRVQSPAMARGEAFHDFAERAVREVLRTGEVTLVPDVARELMEVVIEDRKDLVVPHYERDALRGMAWNFAAATEARPIDPRQIKGLEVMPELKVGDWIVRGRIDRVEQIDRAVYIRDYKTSLNIPSQERFDRGFQLPLYALCWSEGTIDGKRVGEGIDAFNVAEEYPRFLSKECVACGKFNDHHADAVCKECEGVEFRPPTVFKRVNVLGKRDLHDFKRHVGTIIGKLDHALAADEWPASPGSHCATCAAPPLCPLPRSLRPATVQTPEEAVELAQDVDRAEQELKRNKAALKDWASANGEIRYGDKECGFLTVRSKKTDKKALDHAMADVHIDPRDFQKQTTSTRFVTRTVEGE